MITKIKNYWLGLNPNVRRYIHSSVISFITGFGMVLLTNTDQITIESIKNGSYVGVLLIAFRAGAKAAYEGVYALLTYLKQSQTPQ